MHAPAGSAHTDYLEPEIEKRAIMQFEERFGNMDLIIGAYADRREVARARGQVLDDSHPILSGAA